MKLMYIGNAKQLRSIILSALNCVAELEKDPIILSSRIVWSCVAGNVMLLERKTILRYLRTSDAEYLNGIGGSVISRGVKEKLLRSYAVVNRILETCSRVAKLGRINSLPGEVQLTSS